MLKDGRWKRWILIALLFIPILSFTGFTGCQPTAETTITSVHQKTSEVVEIEFEMTKGKLRDIYIEFTDSEDRHIVIDKTSYYDTTHSTSKDTDNDAIYYFRQELSIELPEGIESMEIKFTVTNAAISSDGDEAESDSDSVLYTVYKDIADRPENIEMITDENPPIPGNNGKINIDNITGTSVEFSWAAGEDDITYTEDLRYAYYIFDSDVVKSIDDTVLNADNRIKVEYFETNILSGFCDILEPHNTYYIYVFIRDEKYKTTMYEAASFVAQDEDLEAPIPGGSGTIINDAISVGGFSVSWVKASDDVTLSENLKYCVYYSMEENINTLENILANGTKYGDFEKDINRKGLAGLTEGKKYYVNVIVEDDSGKQSAYAQVACTTGKPYVPPAPPANTAPTAGGGGALSSSNEGSTSIKIHWTKATDAQTAQSGLMYLVYYSLSDNINTVSQMQANGTAFGTYTADISYKEVTSLAENTTYFFNVIVKDTGGLKTAYTAISADTVELDTIKPTPGNSSNITVGDETTTSVKVSWTKATDNTSPQTELKYVVYYSKLNNIETIAEIESNGTKFDDYVKDIDQKTVTGLDENTTYYFNVIVMDEAGNKSAHNTASTATLDGTAPVPGNSSTITGGDNTETTSYIAWTAATDNVTAQTNLQYQVYYSKSNNIDTVSNCESNGTAFGSYTANITDAIVTGLTAGTTHYFNVVVRDEAGNKTAYTMHSEATLDDLADPVPGGGGVVGWDLPTPVSIQVLWTAATDDITVQANLEYRVYYSLADNISTLSDAINNGTMFCDFTANITDIHVTELTPSTTYYFNIVVRDEAGNMSAYSGCTGTTEDSPAT